jgi:hypothetical protein
VATCGNGAGTGIRAVIIAAVRAVTLRDLHPVPTVSYGAAVGAAMPAAVGLLFATTSARTAAAAPWASGFRERLDFIGYLLAGVVENYLLAFLPFYLLQVLTPESAGSEA